MQPWHYIVACAVMVGVVGLVFKLAYDGIKREAKPLNGSIVDLSGVMTGIQTCNTSILKLTRVSSETKGTVEQLCVRVDEVKKEVSGHQEHCNDKFKDLFEDNREIRKQLNISPIETVKKNL